MDGGEHEWAAARFRKQGENPASSPAAYCGSCIRGVVPVRIFYTRGADAIFRHKITIVLSITYCPRRMAGGLLWKSVRVPSKEGA